MSQKEFYLSSDQKVQRRIAVVRLANQIGTQGAAIKTGISDRTIRSWKARFSKLGIAGLKDQSRANKNVWNRKDVDGALGLELARICKEEPGLTRLEIFGKLMCVESKDTPSLAWIARAKRRLGLTSRRLKPKVEHKLRYERAIPGYLQVDTKYVPKAGESGEFLYQFTAIDECTRVRFLGASLTHGAEAARKFLVRALSFYETLGVKVLQVQTDRGTEFTLPQTEKVLAQYASGKISDSVFTQECNARGIRHRLIKPRSPELNGKVERSHRIDSERFYSRYEFASAHDLEHALQMINMPDYNERRPHGALGNRTPMEYLKLKIKEIEHYFEQKNAA